MTPASKHDPWPVRLAACRQAVQTLKAELEKHGLPALPPEYRTLMADVYREAQAYAAIVTEHHADLSSQPAPPGDEMLAHILALTMVMTSCNHVNAGGLADAATRPFYYILACRRIACRPCLTAWQTPPPEVIPRDRCDMCEQPTRVFRETHVAGPGIVIFGNLCEPCYTGMHRAKRKARQ